MRHEIEIGGKHRLAFEDGVLVAQYDGEIDEQNARALLRASTDWTIGVHSIWCSDLSKMEGYSPAARKVMASNPHPAGTGEVVTHLFMSGATIKTKAIFSLVFAATRLMGQIKYHTVWCDSFDEALRLAKARFVELERAGLVTLPAAARAAG